VEIKDLEQGRSALQSLNNLAAFIEEKKSA
jgi:hypothetical protein